MTYKIVLIVKVSMNYTFFFSDIMECLSKVDKCSYFLSKLNEMLSKFDKSSLKFDII